jgi:hypothetical protein
MRQKCFFLGGAESVGFFNGFQRIWWGDIYDKYGVSLTHSYFKMVMPW